MITIHVVKPKITKFFEPLGPIFEKLGNFVQKKIAPHVMEALKGIEEKQRQPTQHGRNIEQKNQK